MRPKQHEANLIHPWVFIQARVWVDAEGVEHELAHMDDNYVANVIGFCRHRAEAICDIVARHGINDLWHGLKSGHSEEPLRPPARRDHLAVDAAAWLEATPLMQALRKRLGDPDDAQLEQLIDEAQAQRRAVLNAKTTSSTP